jgi:hypothetical protein
MQVAFVLVLWAATVSKATQRDEWLIWPSSVVAHPFRDSLSSARLAQVKLSTEAGVERRRTA